MKVRGKLLILGLVLVFALTGVGLAAPPKMMEWDGTHWKELTLEIKTAYIAGMGNMASFETAMGGSGRAACLSRTFVDELKTRTVGQVIDEVDKFYKENPDKLSTPVIEVVLKRCTKLCLPEPPAPEKKK
jgi:hypothetical protein